MTTIDDAPTFGSRVSGTAAVDPDLAPAGAAPSDLDDITAELNAEITPTVSLPVAGRQRYAATYRLDFTGRDLDTWRKRSKDKTFGDGVNGVRFAALLLASTCTAIIRDGEPLELDDNVTTFASRPFQELLGVDRAVDAVLKFYGLEGNADAAARAVMTAAGWGDDLEAVPADPTK